MDVSSHSSTPITEDLYGVGELQLKLDVIEQNLNELIQNVENLRSFAISSPTLNSPLFVNDANALCRQIHRLLRKLRSIAESNEIHLTLPSRSQKIKKTSEIRVEVEEPEPRRKPNRTAKPKSLKK